jgi:hypothetical protein
MKRAAVSLLLLAACGPEEILLPGDDAAAPVDRAAPSFDAPPPPDATASLDAPTAPEHAPADDVAPTPDAHAPPPDAVDLGNDDAQVVEAWLPMTLGCTAGVTAMVDVRNTGTTTWTARGGYALGAVGDSDPLTASTRLRLRDDESVAPGEVRRFEFALTSPGRAGMFTTDWRVVREGVRWFGGTASQEVRVRCDPPATVESFRLSSVTILGSPDVRDFPVTSHITSLSFRPGTFHIDHERRGMWPPVQIDPDGTTQEATVWVFFFIEGQWYATGGERLRPHQTDKALINPSSIGPDWLYARDRWGVMTGYVPSPGDLVGFMVVAGSTRSDNNVAVRERSAVVLVPFPRDGVETSFPPFAWQE